MTAREQILEGLRDLAASGTLPRSACGASLLRVLRPLLDAQVVAEVRSGAGRSLVVRNASALEAYIRAEFPQAHVDPGAGTRERGVAAFRDSKTLKSDTPEIVTLRAWAGVAFCKDGRPVDVAGTTRAHQVFSFLVSPEYTIHSPVALVENPALFLNFERLGLAQPLVFWSRGGNISGTFLRWLQAQPDDFSLLHLPDYDPVGLKEFMRLREALGQKARLHVPPDLPEKFARFGNRRILDKENNRAFLAGLADTGIEEVDAVVRLILNSNACLEQEALLIGVK